MQAPIVPVIAAKIRAHPGSFRRGRTWPGRCRRSGCWSGCRHSARGRNSAAMIRRKGFRVWGADAGKLERANGISLVGRSVLVTAGADTGFLNAPFAIADAGDEIILPSSCCFNQRNGRARGSGHQPDPRAAGLPTRGGRGLGNRLGPLPGKAGGDCPGAAYRARRASGPGECCHVRDARGAFHVLVRVEGGGDASALAGRPNREFGAAVIPGTVFGLDGGCCRRLAHGALGPTTAEE